MKDRIRKFLGSLSLTRKLTLMYILSIAVIFAANLYLFVCIDSVLAEIDGIYYSNLRLNDLTDSLARTHADLTSYLSTKSSDSLSLFYEDRSTCLQELDAVSGSLTYAGADDDARILFDNIRALSENYFTTCEETLSAKRGRNIQKYRESYARATGLKDYLGAYLYSLNNRQLQNNSLKYAQFSATFRTLEITSFMILILVSLCSLALILPLLRNAMRPLQRLSAAAGEIGRGNFDIPALDVETSDEVGVVTAAFNQMVVSIRGYLSKLRESMEKERRLKENALLMDAHLKEAELKYLQAQINPHFLFNTLNAGVQLSMMEHADRTYRYLQNVASFFRSKTDREKQVTTLAGEIALIDSYIYIINVRFSGEISYERDLDDTLSQTIMPSMILQPIIENAINHGLRGIDRQGRIILSTYRSGSTAVISVKDNGRGMSAEQIERILSGSPVIRQKGDETNGVGLSNVIGRLRLFYHRDDVFDITSAGEDRGTEVLLYLPAE